MRGGMRRGRTVGEGDFGRGGGEREDRRGGRGGRGGV